MLIPNVGKKIRTLNPGTKHTKLQKNEAKLNYAPLLTSRVLSLFFFYITFFLANPGVTVRYSPRENKV